MSAMDPFVDHLVVDAAGFLKMARLELIGKTIYSVREVIDEIKDKRTLEQLQVLPYELDFLLPDLDDLQLATKLAKSTGDYPVLSITDLKLIAATLQLAKLHVGLDNLKAELAYTAEDKLQNDDKIRKNSLPIGFYRPKQVETLVKNLQNLEINRKDIDTVDGSSPLSHRNSPLSDHNELCVTTPTTDIVDDTSSDASDNSSSPSSNDEDWITSENLGKLKTIDRPANRITVACLTDDFAVQNVLLRAGIRAISTSGLVIKRLNTYVLRCFACLRTTSIMTKKFCPECGNKTLKRVAITVNEDGTKQIHISKRRTINTKGFNKPIPLFRGGKHPNNPVVCPDQPEPENRLSRKALQKLNVLDADYVARESPFLEKDIYSRSALLGVRKLASNNKVNKKR